MTRHCFPYEATACRQGITGGRAFRYALRLSVVAASLWASAAMADCTMNTIDKCTQIDPASAQRLLLREAARNHSPSVLRKLAEFYNTAPSNFRDRAKATWYLRRAAQAGDSAAMVGLGEIMTNGGDAQSRWGVAYLERAATAGEVGPANRALGEYYRDHGQRQKAIAAFQKAADAGDADASSALDEMLGRKKAIPKTPPPTMAKAAAKVVPPKVATVPAAAPAAAAQKVAVAPKDDVKVVEAEPESKPSAAVVAVASSVAPQTVNGDPGPRRADPPSTLAGDNVSVDLVMNAAHRAGFRTEEQLLPAVGIAIAKSGMWSAARNWHPEKGFRPSADEITQKGPSQTWYNGRQMHSDRGLWQIASWAWPQYSDAVCDDPVAAASAVFQMSEGGTDFDIWDSFKSGRAQDHYDRSFDGFPALRPLVRDYLRGLAATAAVASAAENKVEEPSQLTAAEIDAAVSALRLMPSAIEKLGAMNAAPAVRLVTIDGKLRQDAQLNSAIMQSLPDLGALQDAIASNPMLMERLQAQSTPVHRILAVGIGADGIVTIYARS